MRYIATHSALFAFTSQARARLVTHRPISGARQASYRFPGIGGFQMRQIKGSDERSERGARVLLFFALCAAVLWALMSAPA